MSQKRQEDPVLTAIHGDTPPTTAERLVEKQLTPILGKVGAAAELALAGGNVATLLSNTKTLGVLDNNIKYHV